MNKRLHILHVEDEPDFAELVRSLIEQDNLDGEVKHVNTRAALEAALDAEPFDVVLSDFHLPSFTGLDALAIVKQKCPHTPFILISGTIGEQAAIDSLKAGATDYLLKQQPERLASAIRRAVQEAEERARRCKAETELVRREKYFRTLTEKSLDVLSILNREGNFLYNSPSIVNVLGYTPEEVHGQNAFAHVHPEDLPRAREALQDGIDHAERTVKIQLRCQRKDGEWRHLEIVGQNRLEDPEIAGVVLNSRDVTDRWRAEEELRGSERQYRLLFQGNPNPMWVFDRDTLAFLEVNEAATKHYGYSRTEFLAMTVADIQPPAKEDVKKGAALNPASRCSATRHRRKDGSVIDVEVTWSPIRFGDRFAALAMAADVTERRAAEAALRSSETLFRSVWENSADGMRLTDATGATIAVNGAFCKLVGLTREELENKPLTVICREPAEREKMLADYRERFGNNASKRKREHSFTLHNGRDIIFEIADSLVELPGQPSLLLSLFRDVTMQRRLEEQLRQSQKMEAIGQLAGGVAHDFNNILTVIHGHASLLSGFPLDEMAARSAHQISQAAERAASLTRQLLTFSRRQLIQSQRLDLNQIIGNLSEMLGRLLGEDVTLRLDYSQLPATVEADAGMMEQVVLNLAVNARDAMPRGGQLAVRIALMDVDEAHRQQHPEARVGRFVCVGISDTGSGIRPENLPRIFEPFFTTKEVGKGTGLGLATAYGIVKQHQGWIEVESAVGEGTTFHIYIPYVGKHQSAVEKPTSLITIRGGTETILLVEDEKPVRELVARVLEKHGYKVLQAATGAEAVEIWRGHKAGIALLLTDLVMPENMNGRELAEVLRAERADLKVIFTSGYSAEIVGKDFKLEPELNYLQKPYQPQTLILAVRRCLDGKANGNGE